MGKSLSAIAVLCFLITSVPAQAGIVIDITFGPRFLQVTCGIKTVGYRFVGVPGTKFEYAGEQWEIENDGDIELIASRRHKFYRINNKKIKLEGYKDLFSFCRIDLKTYEP